MDLNVDLGELPDEPAALYAIATVVNVACGGHAGDRASMERALRSAAAQGARVAAHPSYPDRAGFGRARVVMPVAELARSVEGQCAELAAIGRRLGVAITTVKPHGALYHDAAGDPAITAALIDGCARGLGVAAITLVGPPRGALIEEAQRRGLAYAREGFADRGYRADGGLVPRGERGALIEDAGHAARQALELAASGAIDTLCVHSDTAGAVAIAGAVREALEARGLLPGKGPG